MNKEDMQSLLCSLLECGYLDLRVLEDCRYDMEDLIEEVNEMGYEKPNLNNLAYAIV